MKSKTDAWNPVAGSEADGTTVTARVRDEGVGETWPCSECGVPTTIMVDEVALCMEHAKTELGGEVEADSSLGKSLLGKGEGESLGSISVSEILKRFVGQEVEGVEFDAGIEVATKLGCARGEAADWRAKFEELEVKHGALKARYVVISGQLDGVDWKAKYEEMEASFEKLLALRRAELHNPTTGFVVVERLEAEKAALVDDRMAFKRNAIRRALIHAERQVKLLHQREELRNSNRAVLKRNRIITGLRLDLGFYKLWVERYRSISPEMVDQTEPPILRDRRMESDRRRWRAIADREEREAAKGEGFSVEAAEEREQQANADAIGELMGGLTDQAETVLRQMETVPIEGWVGTGLESAAKDSRLNEDSEGVAEAQSEVKGVRGDPAGCELMHGFHRFAAIGSADPGFERCSNCGETRRMGPV